MINKKNYIIICIFYLISGCGEQVKSTQKSEIIEEAQKRIIERFSEEKEIFNRLKLLLSINHIKYASFNDNYLLIKYVKGDYESDVNLLSVKSSLDSLQVIEKNLSLDKLFMENILNIKNDLHIINSNGFFISDNYDNIKGRYIKSIDFISDTTTSNIKFHYRIFNVELDSMPKDFYGQPTRFGSTGGTLDRYTIWYYK